MKDDLENYRRQLRHVVRPEDPDDRAEAPSVGLEDYRALYLKRGLVEFAAYEAEDRTEKEIALGYVEHIDRVVRSEDKTRVSLYAHTGRARSTLGKAAMASPPGPLWEPVVEKVMDFTTHAGHSSSDDQNS